MCIYIYVYIYVYIYICVYIYIYFICIEIEKTTLDESEVSLFFFLAIYIYRALLLYIEHYTAEKSKYRLPIYIYIYWGGYMALPPSWHQHCTDEAQKAETVLSAVTYIYIYTSYKPRFLGLQCNLRSDPWPMQARSALTIPELKWKTPAIPPPPQFRPLISSYCRHFSRDSNVEVFCAGIVT